MSQEAIDLLTQIKGLLGSIDGSLKALVAQKRAESPKAVADERDLLGKYGDPQVTFNPRDWSGPSYKRARFSECPAPFLDMLADTLDYFADQAERTDERTNAGKPVADFKRKDAARARGWAKRIREGKVTQTHDTATPSTEPGWVEGEPAWANAEDGF